MVSDDLELGQGMAGMVHVCSMMSGASAGRFQRWKGESSEGSLTCLVPDVG